MNLLCFEIFFRNQAKLYRITSSTILANNCFLPTESLREEIEDHRDFDLYTLWPSINFGAFCGLVFFVSFFLLF